MNDIKSGHYRRKKILNEANGENVNSSAKVLRLIDVQVEKFGQVKPFPVKFSWRFPWDKVKLPKFVRTY